MIRSRWRACGLLCWVWLFFPALAQAQFFVGPNSASMGNAGIAAVDAGESAFINPAALGYLQRYYMSGFYGIGKHPVDGEFSQWAAMLADGTPEAVIPGALSYAHRRLDFVGGASDTQQDMQLAFAGFPVKHLSIGLAAHRQTDQMLSGAQVGSEFVQYNGHFGALWVPTPALGFGFVAYDFLPTANSTPGEVRTVPTFGVGAHAIYEKLFRGRLDFVRPDTHNDGRRINIGTGIETFFREDFCFHLGFQWKETANEDYLTTGLAYRGPRLSVDYTYQKDLRAEGDSYRHMFDLWLPF